MNIIQEIIWHVTKHRILSQTTIFLMSISLLLISIVGLYHIFIKKKDYGKNMALVGVTIRVFMLIAFTVEFYHQMSIYSMKGSKEAALEHLNYLLLLGYVVVVGIYYISTIKTSKYRGFFYTFDIGMMIIPLINIFPILVYLGLEGDVEQVIQGLGFIIMIALSIYLFFRMYWKQSTLSYILLFTVSILPMFVFYVLGYRGIKYNPISIIQIFLVLLGLYEGIRKIVSFIIEKKNVKFKNFQYALSIFPILLIFLTNPFYNIWDLGTSLGKYEIRETYYMGTPLTNMKQAEEVARRVTGNIQDEIMSKYSIHENFHNGYGLEVGDYWVQVASTEGVLLTVNSKKDYKEIKESTVSLKKEDIMQLLIDWLDKVRLTFNPEEIDIEIKEENNRFDVSFNKKFTDGSLLNENSDMYIPDSRISWNKDGTLASFQNGNNFFGINSTSKKILDGLDVEKIVKNWYAGLEEAPQPYAVINKGFGFFPGDPYRLEIIMKNKDKIFLNNNGEVVNFRKENIKKEDVFTGSYEEGLTIAENYLKNICKEWEKYKFQVFDNSSSRKQNGCYEFIYPIDELNSYYIDIDLNSQGEIRRFMKGKTVVDREKYIVKDNFPISRKKALDLVNAYYKPFEIYNVRTMMSFVSDSDGNYKYKWMFVVFPFGKAEHHVYFVDPYTGDIDEVYGYKDGVIGE